jgi:hypothetical protein
MRIEHALDDSWPQQVIEWLTQRALDQTTAAIITLSFASGWGAAAVIAAASAGLVPAPAAQAVVSAASVVVAGSLAAFVSAIAFVIGSAIPDVAKWIAFFVKLLGPVAAGGIVFMAVLALFLALAVKWNLITVHRRRQARLAARAGEPERRLQ